MKILENKNLINNYSEEQWGALRLFIQKNYQPKYILQDRRFFNWQFLKNPENYYGKAAFKVLKINHQLLGHLGIIPIGLKIGKQVSKGAMLCNLMVDKDYRTLGLGIKILQSATSDFPVLIGIGYTPDTAKIYEKMNGWKIMPELNRYIKIINYRNVEKLIKKKIRQSKEGIICGDAAEINVKKIKTFSKSFDGFWRAVSSKYPIAIERKASYLNWRYANHPFFNYEILAADEEGEIGGYIVFRIAKSTGGKQIFRIGHILDLASKNDKTAKELIRQAERAMVKRKVDFIDFHSSGLFHRKVFLELGYCLNVKAPLNLIPMHFNPIETNRPKNLNFFLFYGGKMNDKRFLCDINNWYLTKGDGDKDRPNPH
jgi:predicted N-acetyltransferase YhbS